MAMKPFIAEKMESIQIYMCTPLQDGWVREKFGKILIS